MSKDKANDTPGHRWWSNIHINLKKRSFKIVRKIPVAISITNKNSPPVWIIRYLDLKLCWKFTHQSIEKKEKEIINGRKIRSKAVNMHFKFHENTIALMISFHLPFLKGQAPTSYILKNWNSDTSIHK